MSGETQRQRNAEIDIRKIKAKVGDIEEPVIIHMHDFGEGGEAPPIMTNSRTGQRIKIILHKYPPEPEEERKKDE